MNLDISILIRNIYRSTFNIIVEKYGNGKPFNASELIDYFKYINHKLCIARVREKLIGWQWIVFPVFPGLSQWMH